MNTENGPLDADNWHITERVIRLLREAVTLHREKVFVKRDRLPRERSLRHGVESFPKLRPAFGGGHTE